MDGIRLNGSARTALAGTVSAVAARWRGLLVAAIFTALAVRATWPFAIHPGSALVAPATGDVAGSVAKWMTITREGDIPFLSGKLDSLAWPDGIRATPGLDWASFISTAAIWLGSLTIGPVATHGLDAVLGYVLTGTVTALFVRRVTGSLGAGFVAGLGYAFFPHLRGMASAAPTYTQMWMFILPIWAFWSLAQRPARRAAVLAGLSYLPAMWLTPYYTLHGFVVSVACLIVFVAVRCQPGAPARARLRLVPLVLAPWVVAGVAYVAIGVLTAFKGAPPRPIQDAYDQASHPLMFLVPGAGGTYWPTGFDEWLVRHVPRAFGTNLYLGVSVIALGVIGIVASVIAWRRYRTVTPEVFAALLGSAVVLATLACSLPPRVAGNRLPTPNLIIVTVVPSLRAGQRFVMPLAAGLAILAGLGAAALIRRTPKRYVVPVVALLAAIVYFDTAADFGPFARMPGHYPALEVLARQPYGPAIHYAGASLYRGETQRSCFLQGQFQKPLVTSCGIQQVPLTPQVWDLATHDFCPGMKDMRDIYGLRYVIVERDEPRAMECFDKHLIAPFRLISSDPQMRIFDLRPGAPAVARR